MSISSKKTRKARTHKRTYWTRALVVGLSLGLFSLLISSAEAAEYYIDSARGSDTNLGTTAQPFQTLQHCIGLWDNTTQISCRGSGVFHEALTITKGGPNSTQRNQLIAWDTDGDGDLTDETFVLDGEGTRNIGIWVPWPNGPDNVEVAYLAIQNYNPPNLDVCKAGELANPGNSIFAGEAMLMKFDCGSADSCNNWWIHHNAFQDLAKECSWATGGASIIAIKPGIPNAVIEHNTFDRIGGFIMRYFGGENITFRNNVVNIISAGIKAWNTAQGVKSFKIIDNIFNCDGNGANVDEGKACYSQAAVSISDNNMNPIIRGNTFNNCVTAISVQASDGFSGGIDNTGALIDGNLIFHDGRACNNLAVDIVDCAKTVNIRDLTFRNNTILYQEKTCTVSSDCPMGSSCNSSLGRCVEGSGAIRLMSANDTPFVSNFSFLNNTIRNYRMGIRVDQCKDASGIPLPYQLNKVEFQNNIFSGIHESMYSCSWPGSVPQDWVSDYNTFDRNNRWFWPGFQNTKDFTRWKADTGQDQHSKECIPTFVGATDSHLSSTDACARESGTALSGFTADIDEDPRPQGAAWDIGADEYSIAAEGGRSYYFSNCATGGAGTLSSPYCLDPDGDGVNQSIEYLMDGIAPDLAAGDTAYLCAGTCDGAGTATYHLSANRTDTQGNTFVIDPFRSGTAIQPITIQTYPGETVILSGDSNANDVNDATDVGTILSNTTAEGDSKSNYIWKGIIFERSRDIMINVRNNPKDWLFDGIEIRYTGKLWNGGDFYTAGCDSNIGAAGIKLAGETGTFTVRNSKFHDICGFAHRNVVNPAMVQGLFENNEYYNLGSVNNDYISQNFVWRNNYIHDVIAGFSVEHEMQNVTIEDNVLACLGQYLLMVDGRCGGWAISINNGDSTNSTAYSSKGHVVRRNKVYGITNGVYLGSNRGWWTGGIQYSALLQPALGPSNSVIENNMVWYVQGPFNNGPGLDAGGIVVTTNQPVLVQNNTIYNSQYGIVLGNTAPAPYDTPVAHVAKNNLVVQAYQVTTSRNRPEVVILPLASASVLQNNNVHEGTTGSAGAVVQVGSVTYPCSGPLPGTDNKCGATTFTNTVGTKSSWDLHLASTDVSNKDAGTTGTATDIDNDPRPQGVAWDIGADEYTSAPAGLSGDLDNNSLIDILDLQRLVNVLLGTETDQAVIARADLDSQNGVNVQDLQLLVNLLLGG